MNKRVDIEDSWYEILEDEFEKPYFLSLIDQVRKEYKTKNIFPKPGSIFKAFNLTPLDSVKVVILGQDPYHGPGQAQGLCFSVPKGIKRPPSLVNIFKEIRSDLGIELSSEGCLEAWAHQGVFLLNSSVTVEESCPNSHKNLGWTVFTDHVIEKLSRVRENLVFLLWGAFAKKKAEIIEADKHLVLEAAHPSPLSAFNGFFGCRHFSKANSYLESNGIDKIDWGIY